MASPRKTVIHRVVISDTGEARPMPDAARLGIHPDVLLLRNDGWVLGAPYRLASVAWDLWPSEWVTWADLRADRWERYDTGANLRRLAADAEARRDDGKARNSL